MNNAFIEYLNKFSEAEWLDAVETLLPSIHEVDRNATQIWFRFYPLELFRYLESAEDKDAAVAEIGLQGNYRLADQVDSSHHFLYGHRYWPEVKAAIESENGSFCETHVSLVDKITEIAKNVSEKQKVNSSLLTGISAVGLMTLVQAGAEAFKAAAGTVEKPHGLMARSAAAIVSERAKDDSQGMLGFLKTINKKYSIIYDETSGAGKFPVMNDQEITSASAEDRSQNWQERDSRCWNGVIPVECTAAACGTCWIGVIAGAEKLTDVARRERRAMKVFGYEQPDGDRPILRLACQAKALGNATIVIPPWNANFGKTVYGNVEDIELDPVTTSAKKLRETLASVGQGDGSKSN
jgi:ferredoxin